MRSKNLPEVLKADIDFQEKDCRGSYRNFKLDKKTEDGNRKPTNRTAFQKKILSIIYFPSAPYQ